MQLARCTETFNGHDLVSVMHQSKAEARVHAPAIHMNRTGSTLTVVTALFGTGEMNNFSEAIEEGRSRINAKLMLFSIDAQNQRQGTRPFICAGFIAGLGLRFNHGHIKCCNNANSSSGGSGQKGSSTEIWGLVLLFDFFGFILR